MDEYIKREAAIRKINGEFPDAHYPSWYAALLEEVPAADVVEVVRCKDCTYYEGDRCGFWEEYPKTEKNDFCSNGKKRAK